ncbi:MAG TPA: S8 family serine peptidase, partial [Isosphaeraceae bacterium]|nr:S8 family serine peptidase [Isosphaeraceae bacterium]
GVEPASAGRRVIVESLPIARPRCFERIMDMNDLGAAAAPVEAVVNALSRKFLSKTDRTYPVYVEDRSGLRVVATDEITLRFKAKTPTARRNKLLQGLGLTAVRPAEFVPDQFVVAPSSPTFKSGYRTVELACELHEANDVVEMAAPNFLSEHRKCQVPNDPLFGSQWHLNNAAATGALAGEDVRALDAWKLIHGGNASVVIAIIDDGVDLHHPDLRANIWSNPNSVAPDLHGRNFYDGSFDPSPHYFLPPYYHLEGNDIHGTPCAGVAAAVGNNRKGVTGIAFRCRILAVKVFGADGLAPNDRVADGIRYAAQHAAVICCGWTAPASNPDLEAAIQESVQSGREGKGTLVFCASGNGDAPGKGMNRLAFPASHALALAVGASNDLGKRSRYSNYGKGLEFVAPSSDVARQGITTTDVARKNRGYSVGDSYTDEFGGTSSAAALAAGIAALVVSANPELSWHQVREILRATADKIDKAAGNYQKGWSEQYGYGRLNAGKAVAAAVETTGGKPHEEPKPAAAAAKPSEKKAKAPKKPKAKSRTTR